jgi:hypothetical protein
MHIVTHEGGQEWCLGDQGAIINFSWHSTIHVQVGHEIKSFGCTS